jgi:hypothetical protein
MPELQTAPTLRDRLEALDHGDLVEEVLRLDGLINTPQITDFIEAMKTEAAHQRERWGDDHDKMKRPEDWFWLIGYLGGKIIRPDTTKSKRLHRIVTVAAACLNWHRHEVRRRESIPPG